MLINDVVHPAGWEPWSAFVHIVLWEVHELGLGARTGRRVCWAGYQWAMSVAAEATKYTMADFIFRNSWLLVIQVEFDIGLHLHDKAIPIRKPWINRCSTWPWFLHTPEAYRRHMPDLSLHFSRKWTPLGVGACMVFSSYNASISPSITKAGAFQFQVYFFSSSPYLINLPPKLFSFNLQWHSKSYCILMFFFSKA